MVGVANGWSKCVEVSFVVIHPWVVLHSVAVFGFDPGGVVSFGYDKSFILVAAAVCYGCSQCVMDPLFVECCQCHSAVVFHSWWNMFFKIRDDFVDVQESITSASEGSIGCCCVVLDAGCRQYPLCCL